MKEKWDQLQAFFAGRWQIPLALAAVALSGVTLMKLAPQVRPQQVDTAFADIVHLAKAGAYTDAADAAANLLHMEPPLPEPQRARLHNFLANLIYERQRQLKQPVPAAVHQLLEHHREAEALGHPQDTEALMRLATARDWLGDTRAAAFHYREVLGRDPRPADRRAALRRLIALSKGQPEQAPTRRRHITELLEDPTATETDVWWALRQGVADALDVGDTLLARRLIESHGQRLANSNFTGYLEHLRALVLVHEGRYDEAAPVIFWVEDWLHESAPQVTSEMDDLGKLPALNQWLLGRMELEDLRPQTALQAFDETLGLHPGEDLRIAATVGRAQALSMLERHDAALATFREVTEELFPGRPPSEAAVATLRDGLVKLFEQRYAREQYDTSLGYLELAAGLLEGADEATQLELYETLGQALRTAALAADQGHPNAVARSRREYNRAAGEALAQAAPLALEGASERYHGLLWEAAAAFDAAGYVADARRQLNRFLETATNDPRRPRAYLRLGQGYAVQGQYDEAIAAYRALIDAFPKLEEAARAQVYIADCQMAGGPAGFDAAAATLEELLAGPYVEPEAPVFREAFLRLGELRYHQGEYADAIGRLEAFQQLYPDDPEIPRVLFLAAETYRKSGEALQSQVADDDHPARVRGEAKHRLQVAADLYGQYLRRISDTAAGDGRLAQYERLALFNRGNCLFQLNTPEALREGIETYRQAAALYELEPAALTAQVQLANAYLRLGLTSEAARAVERARWLLRNIPEGAFDGNVNASSRKDWDQYLATIASSRLFADGGTNH